ncbi:MAG: 3-phosphoshikimate 1-carboxyvinyltransferase [candidate division WOR-3 bacterium]
MNLCIKRCNRITGEFSVGGDKSITHRCLILGAIADGETKIYNFSHAEDCFSTLKCLKSMGIEIYVGKECVSIKGKGVSGLKEPEDVLNCGNSGTTMRLLTGLLAGQEFYSVLTGDDSLRRRPMKRVIAPLRMMGAEIRSRKNSLAPLSITGKKLKAIEYKLPVASAQVKSALMLAGLYADSETIIEEPIFTRDHTERLFDFFNIKFIKKENKIIVYPAKNFPGRVVKIPNDISSAAFFIVLGILVAEKIVIKETGVNQLRCGIIEVLKENGADITLTDIKQSFNEPIADIIVKKSEPSPFTISGSLVPRLIDEIPILVVLATQLKGRSVIRNAEELRVKETDRIKAICNELNKLGADIEEIDDGLIINGPAKLKGAVCESYNDHRIAMALAIAGLIAEGETVIKNADCINISFPEFINILSEVCGEEYIQRKY